ncbi:MAG TPA: GNAT family N-acetyltransferase, partial [Micromonosporaceae bacterium]
QRAAGGPFTTLVADLDGTVVGFTTVGRYRNGQNSADLDPAYGEILAVYVEPAHWGTGIGRELLRGGCAVLSAQGFAEVRLWVLADNLRARRFYERAGLFADGERSVYRVRPAADEPPVELPEVRYARRLDQ